MYNMVCIVADQAKILRRTPWLVIKTKDPSKDLFESFLQESLWRKQYGDHQAYRRVMCA